MARRARRKSDSGIYHVMARGIDRQEIFRNPEDYEKYRQVLKECKSISGYELYAYCLMPNHVHLLFHESEEGLGKTFQRIGSRYAAWFNKKYARCGHLFQDRFKSEPVEDDRYFLVLLRYIHLNPVAAKICRGAADYRWSSYRELVGKSSLIDPNYPLKLFSDSKRAARLAFMEHVCYAEDPQKPQSVESYMRYGIHLVDCMSSEMPARLHESESILQKQFDQRLAERDEYIRKLKSEGIPMRQIAEHLKTSVWAVRKA
jgi:REP element-mobilizing transposase RayT